MPRYGIFLSFDNALCWGWVYLVLACGGLYNPVRFVIMWTLCSVCKSLMYSLYHLCFWGLTFDAVATVS
jgi:hypothetical protein